MERDEFVLRRGSVSLFTNPIFTVYLSLVDDLKKFVYKKISCLFAVRLHVKGRIPVK